jgi:Uma2 family endonuclease
MFYCEREMTDESASNRAMSFEEFEARYTGKRYEYVDGKALPRGPEIVGEDGKPDIEPKKPEQMLLEVRVAYLVGKHVIDQKLGVPLVGGVGFWMRHNPPELRECDFAFLSPERAALCKMGEWLPFPPDFAVEVVSAWDKGDYIQRKSHSYMENGTRLLWVIHPDTQQVEVYRPDHVVKVLGIGDTLDGGDVVAGLAIRVSEVFSLKP